MSKKDFRLGNEADLKVTFSYPNIPGNTESLEETILHWVGMTLERDGLRKDQASIRTEGSDYYLALEGVTEAQFQAYEERFPKILDIGLEAWEKAVPRVKKYGKWDPDETGLWRFFLTLGVGIVEHRTLQFFHYPPIRLLNPLRDSMHDPVTARVRDLLEANGVPKEETKYYETRINSTPIAADDGQGTSQSPNADPITGGLMPIEFFQSFQRDMINTLIKPHPTCEGYTIPMVVYGRNPTRVLGGMFLKPNVPIIVQVLNGMMTPVLASNHPYRFYATAQGGGENVGKPLDTPKNPEKSEEIEIDDLSVVYWQLKMAENPSQNPWKLIKEAQEYWKAPEQKATVCALVKRHTSLSYYEGKNREGAFDPEGKHFHFDLEFEEALELCKQCDNKPC